MLTQQGYNKVLLLGFARRYQLNATKNRLDIRCTKPVFGELIGYPCLFRLASIPGKTQFWADGPEAHELDLRHIRLFKKIYGAMKE